MTDRPVELRSDTFTRPTEAMRRAMYEAEVGDDVWDEDPTVDQLEALAAELTEKEAGLFVPSGTQGNLVGLLSHTSSGNEVILGDQSHIFWFETAGTAVVGGIQLRTLPNSVDGRLAPAEVQAAIRDARDEHFPLTGAVALENTHNRCGGAVLDPGYTAEIVGIAHGAGVPVHLDGARVFNAAAALRLPVAEIVGPVDSVTFCLSKALGAPVGSVLCGSAAYIKRARRWRKLLGGGMRQVGVLAAAGLVALQQNRDRLVEDHENARLLAEGLAAIPGITVDVDRVVTNMVFFDIEGTGLGPVDFVARLKEQGIRLAGETCRFRAVTSYEVTRQDIERTLRAIDGVVKSAVLVGT